MCFFMKAVNLLLRGKKYWLLACELHVQLKAKHGSFPRFAPTDGSGQQLHYCKLKRDCYIIIRRLVTC